MKLATSSSDRPEPVPAAPSCASGCRRCSARESSEGPARGRLASTQLNSTQLNSIRGARHARVVIAGNPNTGKTTIFNRLTGNRAKVGNFPGVTVEGRHGLLELPSGGTVSLVDVPGTYSLASRSQEEELAVRAVAGLNGFERPDAVVLVVDATQLVRNLYFALQVLELGAPAVVALNMTDQLEESGLVVSPRELERVLGVPVVPVVGHRGHGLEKLRSALEDVLHDPGRARQKRLWEPEGPLAGDVEAVRKAVPPDWTAGNGGGRGDALALWALLSLGERDELRSVPDGLRQSVLDRRRSAELSGRDLDEEIVRGRYAWIEERSGSFLREPGAAPRSLTDRVDRVLLHPVLGFALFVALMTLVFQSLFTGADPAIGAIESAVGWLSSLVRGALPAGFLSGLLADGLVQGVGSVLVFLPQILLLFLFLGLMEDTGYMARVAFLMDRIMKAIGLHGRAFVPMLSGYACAVPAILATRTMERRRDRLLTMMVIPLMTCSARLPVYGLLIAALLPVSEAGGRAPFLQGFLLAAMYLFSTVIALVAAAVLGRTVLRGPRVPLLLEMPPYRLPYLPSVLRRMWEESAVFVRQAGTIILACSVLMWFLLAIPVGQSSPAHPGAGPGTAETPAGPADSSQEVADSLAGHMGRALEPALEPLGFDWKIGIGLIGAFAAREVFVSTMAVVYGIEDGEGEDAFVLRQRIREDVRADGTPVFTPLVCLSLMVFFALACQCMSTLAVVRRETGTWTWPAFLFAYMTALAWLASLLVYQGGRWLGFE